MTVLFIHGIGDQPPAEEVKLEWDECLFGASAVFSQLVYWSNLRPHKLIDDTFNEAFSLQLYREIKTNWLFFDKATELVTKLLLADVYDYFYNQTLRTQIEALMRAALKQEPEIIVAHSLGTVIAYEALVRENAHVPLLVTMGSPLGLEAIKSQLRRVMHVETLPLPRVDYWLNVADPFDPVAADKTLSDDYHTHIAEVCQRIGGSNPHDSRAYLKTRVVKETVMMQLTRGHQNA